MKLHDYFPTEGKRKTRGMPADGSLLETETLFGEHGLFSGPIYKGTPMREVDVLPDMPGTTGDLPVGAPWRGFRAHGDAEYQRYLNQCATAALKGMQTTHLDPQRLAATCTPGRASFLQGVLVGAAGAGLVASTAFVTWWLFG